MATIFPANPVRALPPAVLKTFRALKALPDDYFVWHHLAKWEPEAPDFLIRSQQDQAMLIKISSASSQEARPAAQLLLVNAELPPLGEAEEKVLRDFLSRLAPNLGKSSPSQIQAVVIFSNIDQKKLDRARPKLVNVAIQWWGQEVIPS